MTSDGRISSYDPNAPRPLVGSQWIWEIDDVHARCLVEVTGIEWNGEEWWVQTEALLPAPVVNDAERPWNDLSRFWEAVMPVGGRWDDLSVRGPVVGPDPSGDDAA